jgi:hypothetical protein
MAAAGMNWFSKLLTLACGRKVYKPLLINMRPESYPERNIFRQRERHDEEGVFSILRERKKSRFSKKLNNRK